MEHEPRFGYTAIKYDPHTNRTKEARMLDLKYRYSSSRQTRSLRTSKTSWEIEVLLDGIWEYCCNVFFNNSPMKYYITDYAFTEIRAINSDNAEFFYLPDLLEKVEEILKK